MTIMQRINDMISILPVNLPVSTIVKTPRVAFLYSLVPAPLQMQTSRKLSWETLFELITQSSFTLCRRPRA